MRRGLRQKRQRSGGKGRENPIVDYPKAINDLEKVLRQVGCMGSGALASKH